MNSSCREQEILGHEKGVKKEKIKLTFLESTQTENISIAVEFFEDQTFFIPHRFTFILRASKFTKKILKFIRDKVLSCVHLCSRALKMEDQVNY